MSKKTAANLSPSDLPLSTDVFFAPINTRKGLLTNLLWTCATMLLSGLVIAEGDSGLNLLSVELTVIILLAWFALIGLLRNLIARWTGIALPVFLELWFYGKTRNLFSGTQISSWKIKKYRLRKASTSLSLLFVAINTALTGLLVVALLKSIHF